jgi:bacteriocin biosynthesis cyclodehydratase domain-containing protein
VSAPGRIVLEHGQRIVCLEGRAAERFLPALLPLLDGTHRLEDLVGVLGESTRPAIEQALDRLEAAGVLVDGPPIPAGVPAPFAGAAELLASLRPGAATPAEAARSLGACSVAVVGDGLAGREAARLLRLSGVEVVPTETVEPGFDLTICAPSPAGLPRLGEWNVQALESRASWLQVLPFDGRYAAIGPLYLPGDTCCHECFRLRRAANTDAADELPLLDDVPGRHPAAQAPDAVVGGLAALLALSWLVLGDHHAPAAFYALELTPTFSLSLHHVHRVPRCPACSGLADVAPPLPWYKEAPLAAD